MVWLQTKAQPQSGLTTTTKVSFFWIVILKAVKNRSWRDSTTCNNAIMKLCNNFTTLQVSRSLNTIFSFCLGIWIGGLIWSMMKRYNWPIRIRLRSWRFKINFWKMDHFGHWHKGLTRERWLLSQLLSITIGVMCMIRVKKWECPLGQTGFCSSLKIVLMYITIEERIIFQITDLYLESLNVPLPKLAEPFIINCNRSWFKKLLF